ncbi:MAG: hypothetical protein GXP38_06290 [Chloroflexi bacterium]|nr:hypothetical protein [Chloroflexota bacterium]
MKKLLLVSLVVVAMLLIVANVASANGGPHGNYTATTDACAGCHRAHTASGGKLLMASSTYDLCVSCHGTSGTGANTNVEDGLFVSGRGGDEGTSTTNNANLLGGGFVNYKGAAVTSSHDPTGTETGAWGAGGLRGVTGTIDALDCASCHDPHGSTNYRLIKTDINGVSPITVSQSDEGAAKDYGTENWASNQSNVCGACHDPYQHAANYPSDPTFTHPVDQTTSYTPSFTDTNGDTVTVPLAGTSDNYLVCQTCHLPHGTSVAMTGYAAGAGPAGDSALLRADNRGVCQACHKK